MCSDVGGASSSHACWKRPSNRESQSSSSSVMLSGHVNEGDGRRLMSEIPRSMASFMLQIR